MQRIDPVHRRIIHCDDEIARVQIRLRRWTLLIATHDLNCARHGQIERPHQASIQRSVTDADSQVGSPNTSLRQDFCKNPLRSPGWYCEADALRHRNNRSVYADNPPARIHQRAARVSRVERCRVLNDTFYETAMPTPERSAECAHDACGHC